jgi:choice-of-anchor B domain-containing protein
MQMGAENKGVIAGFLGLGLALAGVLATDGHAQTIKAMTTLGTFIRPGTVQSSAGIWGWTGATGKEYALLTSRKPGGVCIVDISTPATPKEINFIPSTGNSIWHELNGYKNYIYKVSQENSDGLQIIDMSPLNQGKPAVLVKSPTTWFKTAHTVFVDTTVTPARLFVSYESTAGVMIFTLEDPENPKLIRTIVGEAHDMYGRGDRLYVSNQFKATLTIWNIANVATTTPLKVSVIDFNATDVGIGEPAKGISHNSWPSDDNKVLFTTEETAGTTIKSWDISNPTLANPPKMLGKYIGVKGIIGHNVYLKGSLMFVGHYTAGLRVLDVSDPTKMKELAFHRPSTSTDLFGGTWGVYPWFKSGNIIHGDDVQGLFVEKLDASVVGLMNRPSGVAAKTDDMSIRALENGKISLRLSEAGPYVMSLYSTSGQQLFNLPSHAAAVEQTVDLSREGLSHGNYLLRVSQGKLLLSAPIALGN